MATKKKEKAIPEVKDINVQLKINTITVPIVSVAPLIMSRFDTKTQQQIIESGPGKAKQGKKKMDTPEEQYERSIYRFADSDDIGMPAVSFKSAMVRAAQVVYEKQMVRTRTLFHVLPEGFDDQGNGLIKLNGKPRMRTDMVRIGTMTKTASPRYRAEVPQWDAKLTIQYVDGQISEEEIVSYINAAGFCCGVGEWRPEKSASGSFGLFRVAS